VSVIGRDVAADGQAPEQEETSTKRCNAMVDIGGRKFLTGAGVAAAAAVTGSTWMEYPSNRLANVADLKINEPMDVRYPDGDILSSEDVDRLNGGAYSPTLRDRAQVSRDAIFN